MVDKNKFNLGYLVAGEGMKDWWKAAGAGIKLAIIGIVLFLIIFGLLSTYRHFFPSSPKPTSATTVGHIESGGVSNVTNIVNQSPKLSQGVYIKGATDRVSAGVFRELNPLIDLSLGGGHDFDKEDEFLEVEARVKF